MDRNISNFLSHTESQGYKLKYFKLLQENNVYYIKQLPELQCYSLLILSIAILRDYFIGFGYATSANISQPLVAMNTCSHCHLFDF